MSWAMEEMKNALSENYVYKSNMYNCTVIILNIVEYLKSEESFLMVNLLFWTGFESFDPPCA